MLSSRNSSSSSTSKPSPPPSKPSMLHRIRNAIGFNRSYNLALWFIFSGALFGFTLARFSYLNFRGIFCPKKSSGGNECYYYLNFPRYHVGIILHLATILPACLLVLFQFTPVIRQKFLLFHRINGYTVLLLFALSTAGALMIARHTFGGGLDTQSAVGFLALLTVGSFIISIINIKRLQIEQHRAWMLRGWFYAGCIITTRIIMIIAAMTISSPPDGGAYYTARPCDQLLFIHKTQNETLTYYPTCESYFNGSNSNHEAIVRATMNSTKASEITAALGVSFGMALWLALAIHAVGVEIYLHITPKEAERLRNVSFARQMEAGMKNSWNGGLAVQRLGDAETWVPREH
ncbi:hypothetical protein BCR34DRAFT_637899 [Clohesyomyces aquaticus]|uniref:Uncharacterized protein n=1 Tax=Clohesyomyces aquaticus TaxID=1231657 RepID=A0A1Y2A278_9PLEO|nr:hypothetical protein BCR34DRAFT_637899 [Clohesyomyces aquaticus]